MASPYTSVAVSGYNANPPADDGSAVSTNQIKWATIKTKLDDPLNTAIASINANVVSAIAKTPAGASTTSTGVNVAVTNSDQGKWFRATASGITITFPDATSVTSPFIFQVLNSSAANITIAGAGGQTINGSTSLTMASGDGYAVFTDGSNWFVTGRKTGVLPRGYIDGCILANGADATNDITIAAGVCRDSTNTIDITVAAMATGKQLDANWAPGDAAGMRNSAVGIANTTYHIYAVAKADGTQDIYAHTSTTVATVITALQAESGGASYVYARLIGSIVRLSNALLTFVQVGDEFIWKTAKADANSSTATATPGNLALTVPTGIQVRALFAGGLITTNNHGIGFWSPDETDQTVAIASFFSYWNQTNGSGTLAPHYPLRTNTSAQIRVGADASVNYYVMTRGFIHPRGKDA